MELRLLICNNSRESQTVRVVSQFLDSVLIIQTNAKAPEDLSDLIVDSWPSSLGFVPAGQGETTPSGASVRRLPEFIANFLSGSSSRGTAGPGGVSGLATPPTIITGPEKPTGKNSPADLQSSTGASLTSSSPLAHSGHHPHSPSGCHKVPGDIHSPIHSEELLERVSELLRVVPIRPLLLVFSGGHSIHPIEGALETTRVTSRHIFGLWAILRFLVSGRDDDEQFHFINWASEFCHLLNCVGKDGVEDVLHRLDEKINGREFLVGNTETAVDLLVSHVINVDHLFSLGIDIAMFTSLSRYLSRRLPLRAHSRPFSSGDPFFITSAIAYTNGLPHIGHAYESICCDILARFHRLAGRRVIFSTGTDEHGQKVDQKAESQGKAPIEVCNFYSNEFKRLYERLDISYDDFVRTTEERHREAATWVWSKVVAKGDIYPGTYKGWYSVREERFIPGAEAKLTEYRDPCTGVPYQQVEEPSYFFIMERYRQKLIHHIETHPFFIMPERTRNEMLSRLQNRLEDLSISRTSFSWGIPVPGDDKHVMYVWFDALSNYITASRMGGMWPPNLQVIGKDISWFHCVIWPCMLLAMGMELPRTIFSHGFIQSSDGRKMSKSLGNVLDVEFIMDKFGEEALRYYLARSSVFGADVSFDLDSLVDLYNADLADVIGNLVHRVTSLCLKYSEGKVPRNVVRVKKPLDTMAILSTCMDAMGHYNLQSYTVSIIGAFKECNAYLTQVAPWACHNASYRNAYIRVLLESIYFLAHLLQPILPRAAQSIFAKFGSRQKMLSELTHTFDNLQDGMDVCVGEVLFKKLDRMAATEA